MELNCVFFAASGSGQALIQMAPILLIFAVFYFLLIVPQQRQRRKTQEMLANLKSGDRVITNGGIYGTITGFKDSIVQLQVSSQVRLDVARTAIASLQPDEAETSSKQSEGSKRKF